MESHHDFDAAHWDHDPRAWSADLQLGAFWARHAAPSWSSALRFMGRAHAFFCAHWDHEPRRENIERRTSNIEVPPSPPHRSAFGVRCSVFGVSGSWSEPRRCFLARIGAFLLVGWGSIRATAQRERIML